MTTTVGERAATPAEAQPVQAAASAEGQPVQSAGRRLFRRAGLLSASVAALRTAIASAAESRSPAQAPLASDRDKIAHLLRRAGFGFSADDLNYYAGIGLQATIDQLVNFEQVQDDVDTRLEKYKLNLGNATDLQRWWLLRMIYTKRPLLEKMTLFWHGILVSGYGKVGLPNPNKDNPNPPNLMVNQNQLFREHAMDDFATIMKGISRDPAMIVYLDNLQNRKGKPNENYAREVMELFTLGITGPDGSPNYTEQDIREAARAFTGWALNREQQFAFNAGQHDTSDKTVYGQTGNFNGDDIIDLIMAHPSSAYHLAYKLFSFFVYENPDPATVQPFADVLRASGFSVRAVMQALLSSPIFYSEQAYRAKVKSPVEFLVSMARALQLETDANGFPQSSQRMAQTLFNPPNVAGWPGGVQWFNTTTWLERVNQVNRVLAIRQDAHTQPVNLLAFLQKNKLSSPSQVADYFLNLLVDGQISTDRRQTLINYLTDGLPWPKTMQTVKSTDPAIDRKVRGLVYLVLVMPEFHLA